MVTAAGVAIRGRVPPVHSALRPGRRLRSSGVLIEHGRGTALDGSEAQLPSGGERLSKECTRTISVAGAAPQNEHATPLEPGAGKPRRRGPALIRRLGV